MANTRFFDGLQKNIYIFYINNQMENYLGAWFTLLVVMFGDATIICL